MSKVPPCTIGPKHKWTWVVNFTQGSMTFSSRGSTGRLTLKGKYRCECGAVRIGQPNHNGPDLRELIDGENN